MSKTAEKRTYLPTEAKYKSGARDQNVQFHVGTPPQRYQEAIQDVR